MGDGEGGREIPQWLVKGALAGVGLVVVAVVALAWIPPTFLGGTIIEGGDIAATAAGLSAIGTLALAYVTSLSLQIAREDHNLQRDELEELRKEGQRRNIEQLIADTINPLAHEARKAKELCDDSVGYEYRNNEESTSNLPDLKSRGEHDVVDEDYLTKQYPGLWDDVEEYNQTKDEVIEGLDHQYEAYFDYFRLHCYENQDEIDMPPEQAANILAYGYMGEWNGEVDSEFVGENPLGTAIDIVAEREGRGQH